MSDVVIFSRDEVDLIAAFAGCSLDEKPGSNWVQEAGGLPEYICEVARAIKRSGKTTSQAIAIAVSRIKKWATGAGVDKDTQAKAVKALAQWEAKKTSAKAKTKAKDTVKASSADTEVLQLAAGTDYNVTIVSEAFRQKNREARDAYWKSNPQARYDDAPSSMWVKEQWTKFLIVASDYGEGKTLYKVPYTVDSKLNVTFEEPQPVKTQYVAVPKTEVDDTGISDTALAAMANTEQGACMFTGTAQLLVLSTPPTSALDRVLAFADTSKPYGDVAYADPGYKDGKKRYPINTAAHCRAAWSYINQASNQKDYTSAQVAAIKAKIKAAAKKFGVEISED